MTPLLFAPPTFAEPPSPLQQLAYREGQQALLGPKADPDGWHEVSGKIRGTVFKAREVELSYTVRASVIINWEQRTLTCLVLYKGGDCQTGTALISISSFSFQNKNSDIRPRVVTQLSFALRSYIPVIVTMQCDDVEALRLLSQPSSIVLFLIRRITTGASAMIEGRHPSSEIFLDRTSNAYFWREPGASDDADDTRRVLRGEIPIEVTAKSTVVFPHFTIQVSEKLGVSGSDQIFSALFCSIAWSSCAQRRRASRCPSLRLLHPRPAGLRPVAPTARGRRFPLACFSPSPSQSPRKMRRGCRGPALLLPRATSSLSPMSGSSTIARSETLSDLTS